MSVPAGERGESKLEVLVRARSLAVYTLTITKNTNVFDPAYNLGLTNGIIATATGIYLNAFRANNIYVHTEEDWYRRDTLQQEAIDQCNDLLAYMQMAQELFHLKAKRIKFWGGKTVDCRTMLSAWHKADRKRYAAMFQT